MGHFPCKVGLTRSIVAISFFGAVGFALSLISISLLEVTNDVEAQSLEPVFDGEHIRGVVKATDEAVLTSDLGVPVSATPVRLGDSFKKGDTLLKFNCSVQRAETDAIRASYNAAKAGFANQQELLALEAAGKFDVVLAKSEMDEASARLRAASARLSKCNIIAPFNGRIAQHGVNAHEVPSQDQPLMKIIGSDELELRLIVPSTWLSWLKIGEPFNFVIDETGASYTAVIKKLGAEIDAVSRTIAIVANFEEKNNNILPGMSGKAIFSRSKKPAPQG